MKNQIITSSRRVGMRDINALLQSAPIFRIGCCPQGRDDEGRRGFTLIELLVVVLIIGILAAVALPQYQKAVLKSRFSALMPIAKSIANGNEAYYLEHGTYATSPANLDVAGQKNYPDGTKLDVSTGDYSFVIAGRNNNFPMNYLVYQKHSPKFAGHIHCEADEHNTMAQEICQSLGGQYIPGSQSEGDYKTYVLSGIVGDNDKLPTSLTKLGQTLCKDKPGCTYTINEGDDEHEPTVTTNQCSIGNLTFTCSTSGSQCKDRTGCVDATYSDEGELLKKTVKTCSPAKFQNGVCVPTGEGDFEYTYDKDGNQVGSLKCSTWDTTNNKCNELGGVIGYTDNGYRVEVSRVCNQGNQAFDYTNLTCAGNRGTNEFSKTVTDPDSNVSSFAIKQRCDSFLADGTCSSPYSFSFGHQISLWNKKGGTTSSSCQNKDFATCISEWSERFGIDIEVPDSYTFTIASNQ